jgi:hypothetical protein
MPMPLKSPQEITGDPKLRFDVTNALKSIANQKDSSICPPTLLDTHKHQSLVFHSVKFSHDSTLLPRTTSRLWMTAKGADNWLFSDFPYVLDGVLIFRNLTIS